jgi:RNA polymerase sigma factor (sigma-70 family)
MARGSDPLSDPRPLLRRVYAFIAYRIGPGADAEDVLSEVVERALRYRAGYDPDRGTPLAWLTGIARRVIADRVVPPVGSAAELSEIGDGHDMAAESVERLSLHAALSRMPARDRELLALRYGADMKASQIADVLGMQTNAVEVALHRALARLRELMQTADAPAPEVRRVRTASDL